MKRRTTLLTFLTAIVAIAVLATACSSSGESGSEGPDASQNTAEGGGESGGGESGGGESGGGDSGNQAAQGVVVRSDGPGQNPADTEVIITLDDADGSTDGSITRENVVDGDPLSPDVIDQLLARLRPRPKPQRDPSKCCGSSPKGRLISPPSWRSPSTNQWCRSQR